MIPSRLLELAAHLEEKPVLITGATGGIGRRLVKILTEAGVPLRVLLRHGEVPGVETATGDLTSLHTLPRACQGIHTIFHLASYSPLAEDPHPEAHPLHLEVTVKGTENLIQAAIAAGVEQIVFTSSTRVLDGSSTRYAESKRAAETLLEEAPIPTSTLRLPPVYGFSRRGFIAEMAVKARSGRLPPFPDFGDRRSLIHLDDAVQALLLAARDPFLPGNWTVTDLQEYSMQRIVEAIHRAVGTPRGKPWPPMVFSGGALAGEILQRVLGRPMPLNLERLGKLRRSARYDGNPFAKATGFLPLYTLESALPRMVAEPAQAADDAS